MENCKQSQKREETKKKSRELIGSTTDGVSVMKSTNSCASKGILNTIGARSKTMDLTKSSLSKSTKGSTSGDSLNPPTTKDKASPKSGIKLDGISKIKDTVSLMKTKSLEQEFEKILLASPARSAHSGIIFKPKKPVSQNVNIFQPPPQEGTSSSPNYKPELSRKEYGSTENYKPCLIENKSVHSKISEKNRSRASLIPVKKIEEKKEQKKKSGKVESAKNVLPYTKPYKPNATTLDLDVQIRTTLSNETDLEQELMDSPSVKSVHSGITFIPKKNSPSPVKNIFASLEDGSSNSGQSSNSLNKPSLENRLLKPPKKAQQDLTKKSKDVGREAAEKTGKKSFAATKKIVAASADKATPSKMVRSKTDVSISKNPRIGKPIHKVQSFSRQKPELLFPKKPAHQAISDVATLVKGDPNVVTLPLTTAHSGVPFKPKKPSTFAAVNIFAIAKDDASK